MTTIGFIGGGNMAQAIIAGLVKGGQAAKTLTVSDPNEASRQQVKALGVTAIEDNARVMADAEFIVLAVKPQVMGTVLEALKPHVKAHHRFISIAAGIPLTRLKEGLGLTDQAVIRAMPNTPALIGQGMTALTTANELSDADRATVEALFNACGQTVWVADEEAIDAVTAVSGSGPAYFFLMVEHMIRSAARLGLPLDIATQLVTQTAKGAAAMVEQSDVRPDVLRSRVTSPGGTTAAALKVFEEGAFDDLVDRALIAARDRAAELAKDAG